MKDDIDAKERDRQYHMDAINRLASFLAFHGTSFEVVQAAIDNMSRMKSELEIVRMDRDYWMTRYQTDILCFKDENSHLRKMNQRMIETLVEIAPLKKYVHELEKK
jgi:alpha-glucosidase (family GH31 glycosyl hydrolase)